MYIYLKLYAAECTAVPYGVPLDHLVTKVLLLLIIISLDTT